MHFDYDVQYDQCICIECGTILSNISFANLVAYSSMEPANDTTIEQDGTIHTTTPTKPWKDIYNRRVYIMECFSATCMREPNINEKNKDKIRTEYKLYSEQSWIHQQQKTKRIYRQKIFKTYSNF
jgi:hypothetical protein